jgi:hypothetical protein
VKATLCARYGGKRPRFENQIIIESSERDAFCKPGDSGSLVFSKDGNGSVGLLHSWKTKINERTTETVIRNACIASPIKPVLDHFSVVIDDSTDDPDLSCEFQGAASVQEPGGE